MSTRNSTGPVSRYVHENASDRAASGTRAAHARLNEPTPACARESCRRPHAERRRNTFSQLAGRTLPREATGPVVIELGMTKRVLVAQLATSSETLSRTLAIAL